MSALDAHVGKKIFLNVFKGLFKNKTRIMVTHALQYIKDLDCIYYMKNGKIEDQGKYEELITRNENFREFVNEQQKK